jgi:pimeloyl-ACP methyl ester carboxylesterase
MSVERVPLPRGIYCPFNMDPGSAIGDLRPMPVETAFGSLFTMVSRERQSETATMYVHGIAADWTTWVPILKAERLLQMEVRDQILVDVPGFGSSENVLGRLDIGEVGDTLMSIASTAGYSKIRLVGHSLGGFLALDIASRHPDYVESVHVGAGPYFSILATIQHPWRNLVYSPKVTATFGFLYLLSRADQLGVLAVHALYSLHLMRLLTYPAVRHPFRVDESVVKSLSELHRPRALIQAIANGDGYSPEEQWAKIRCPIWASFGEHDWFVPPGDMDRLLQCQPHAKCSVIREASHLHHIEWPFKVLEALDLWAVGLDEGTH